MDKETIELLHRLGAVVTDVADTLETTPGGDRTFLRSTNDGDRLRELRDEYQDWRFNHPDKE